MPDIRFKAPLDPTPYSDYPNREYARLRLLKRKGGLSRRRLYPVTLPERVFEALEAWVLPIAVLCGVVLFVLLVVKR